MQFIYCLFGIAALLRYRRRLSPAGHSLQAFVEDIRAYTFVSDILNKKKFAPQIFFYLCLQRISNLKWYQPSEDTTVVKQYGPQAKNKRINPFLDRGTKKFNV